MKTKIVFISILFFLQVQNSFSQCISIELSVTWELGHDIFIKDSILSNPKLHITYRNNSTDNYYFRKVSRSLGDLPILVCAILDNVRRSEYLSQNYFKRIKLRGKYFNQNFNVIIRENSNFGDNWYVYNDTIDFYNKPHSFESANCYLQRVSDFYRYKNDPICFLIEEEHFYKFNPSDLLLENILGTINDKFVFLKSGEIFIDTYNLIGFQYIGGCFTFYIGLNEIKSYVLFNAYDSVLKKFVDKEHELPEIVGEYLRYSGSFNTNKVTVCFGEQ
jgi:hypothetical protein